MMYRFLERTKVFSISFTSLLVKWCNEPVSHLRCQKLDKRKKAIFSTQDIEQILGILYDTTGHDMSFEKQEDGTLSVTIDGTVYSVDTVQ